MLSAIWSVLAVPQDDQRTAYLVSNHPNREAAHARRSELSREDFMTTFVVFMTLVLQTEVDRCEIHQYEPLPFSQKGGQS